MILTYTHPQFAIFISWLKFGGAICSYLTVRSKYLNPLLIIFTVKLEERGAVYKALQKKSTILEILKCPDNDFSKSEFNLGKGELRMGGGALERTAW